MGIDGKRHRGRERQMLIQRPQRGIDTQRGGGNKRGGETESKRHKGGHRETENRRDRERRQRSGDRWEEIHRGGRDRC